MSFPNNEKAAPARTAHRKNQRVQSYQNYRSEQGKVAGNRCNFKAVGRAAMKHLPQLLDRLGTTYRAYGHEIVMLNPRRADAHYGSFRINRKTGQWADFALTGVRGGDVVSLVAYLLQVRQIEAAQLVQDILGGRHA